MKRFADYDGDVAAVSDRATNAPRSMGGVRCKGGRRMPAATTVASVEDIERFLDTQARFRYNEATGKCEAAIAGTDGAEGGIALLPSWQTDADLAAGRLVRLFDGYQLAGGGVRRLHEPPLPVVEGVHLHRLPRR